MSAADAIPGLPSFLYGTAWKEDATERLALLAIEQGFRAIAVRIAAPTPASW